MPTMAIRIATTHHDKPAILFILTLPRQGRIATLWPMTKL
jgi:hypothetical protein